MDPQWQPHYNPYTPYAVQIAAGKTAKMLHGANRDHLLGYMGRSANENVTKIFRIFDSNEDIMTKSNELENRLIFEQSENPLMGFTLRRETIKDFISHAFGNKVLDEQFMMRGFTPFCIQQMDTSSEISLWIHEDRMEQTTTTTMNDLVNKGAKLKISPISDVMGFLTAISNTHALAKVLFSTTSPLTIGLQELKTIAFAGKHSLMLQQISNFQPNWFAHVMWAIYGCCNDFFKMRLSRQDLLEGARLCNPFSAFNAELERWPIIQRPGVPPSLRYSSVPDDSSPNELQTETQQNQHGKRHKGTQDNGESTAKKQKQGDRLKPVWKNNPHYDAALQKIKQNIFQAHGRTNLGQLLRASNNTIPAALNTLGFPKNTCGRWTLWGGCGDPACMLTHLEKPILPNQVTRTATLLSEGAAKLALEKAQS